MKTFILGLMLAVTAVSATVVVADPAFAFSAKPTGSKPTNGR